MRLECTGSHVAVGLQYQFAAVPVALPFGNNFDIHTAFDCAGDKHPAK